MLLLVTPIARISNVFSSIPSIDLCNKALLYNPEKTVDNQWGDGGAVLQRKALKSMKQSRPLWLATSFLTAMSQYLILEQEDQSERRDVALYGGLSWFAPFPIVLEF